MLFRSAVILHQGRVAEDVLLDDLHAQGDTLLTRMAKACGWDPASGLIQ